MLIGELGQSLADYAANLICKLDYIHFAPDVLSHIPTPNILRNTNIFHEVLHHAMYSK